MCDGMVLTAQLTHNKEVKIVFYLPDFNTQFMRSSINRPTVAQTFLTTVQRGTKFRAARWVSLCPGKTKQIR